MPARKGRVYGAPIVGNDAEEPITTPLDKARALLERGKTRPCMRELWRAEAHFHRDRAGLEEVIALTAPARDRANRFGRRDAESLIEVATVSLARLDRLSPAPTTAPPGPAGAVRSRWPARLFALAAVASAILSLTLSQDCEHDAFVVFAILAGVFTSFAIGARIVTGSTEWIGLKVLGSLFGGIVLGFLIFFVPAFRSCWA
jgi:hypothetical protein